MPIEHTYDLMQLSGYSLTKSLWSVQCLPAHCKHISRMFSLLFYFLLLLLHHIINEFPVDCNVFGSLFSFSRRTNEWTNEWVNKVRLRKMIVCCESLAFTLLPERTKWIFTLIKFDSSHRYSSLSRCSHRRSHGRWNDLAQKPDKRVLRSIDLPYSFSKLTFGNEKFTQNWSHAMMCAEFVYHFQFHFLSRIVCKWNELMI